MAIKQTELPRKISYQNNSQRKDYDLNLLTNHDIIPSRASSSSSPSFTVENDNYFSLI